MKVSRSAGTPRTSSGEPVVLPPLLGCNGYSFKKVDKKRLKEETRKVNKAIKHVVTKDITELNNLIKAARQLGPKSADER